MTINYDVLTTDIGKVGRVYVLLTNTDTPGEVRALTFDALVNFPVGTTTETEIAQAIAHHFGWSTKAEA